MSWGGGAIATAGGGIVVNVTDQENGAPLADVQVIASSADGSDLVSAFTNASGQAVLQQFEEQPHFVTVIDPAGERNVSFYGNEQYPLRRSYTVPMRRPVNYALQLNNIPAEVGNTLEMDVLVNGTNISSTVQDVDGVMTADIDSGSAWQKGAPVMFLVVTSDAMTGELVNVHYLADFDGTQEDAIAAIDLSTTEAYYDETNNLIARSDWSNPPPPTPEPEPEPDPMDGGMGGMTGGTGGTTAPMESQPELLTNRIWGDVLVPSRRTGVDVSSAGTYVWLELRNSFGTWRVPGSFSSSHAANTDYSIRYPIFNLSPKAVRMVPQAVHMGLGFSTLDPSGQVSMQVKNTVAASGRAPDFNLSAMVLDDAAAEVSLNGLNTNAAITQSSASLVAEVVEGVTLRSSASATAGVLSFPWLTGISQAGLQPLDAVLVGGWSLVRLEDGCSQGIAYSGQDAVPLIGEFNLDGDTEGLTVDLSAFSTPADQAISTDLQMPLSGQGFSLTSDAITWNVDGIGSQEGFFTIWLGGELGGDPMVDLEWQLFVPVGARSGDAESAPWAVAIPQLTIAPVGHQPSTANDSVRVEIGLLDLTRSPWTSDAVDFRWLTWSGDQDMDYIGRASAFRTLRLPTQTDVDLQ